MTGRTATRITRDQAEQIIARVSQQTGIPVDRIASEGRGRPAECVARDAAYAELYATGASTLVIGRLMQRSHSSVVVGLQRHRARGAQ